MLGFSYILMFGVPILLSLGLAMVAHRLMWMPRPELDNLHRQINEEYKPASEYVEKRLALYPERLAEARLLLDEAAKRLSSGHLYDHSRPLSSTSDYRDWYEEALEQIQQAKRLARMYGSD